jgi:streptomycin 6-kinase
MMPDRIVNVPDGVRRKLDGLGDDGRRWLDGLGRVLDEIAAEWQLVLGADLVGSSGGHLVEATAADGQPAVLKVTIPDGLRGHGPFDAELHTLLLANGRGHVRVLRYDEDRHAILLERLGRPLSDLGLPVPHQVEVLATTLSRGWVPVPDGSPLQSTAAKAPWLAEFIETMWAGLDRPCDEAVVREAVALCDSRLAAGDPAEPVLIHGDGHPGNVLEDPSRPGQFLLVDPDGLIGDPAYDLAIPLRDWTAELLAGDALGLATEWCEQLAGLTGVDARAIWEWAFIERVSTGLLVLRHGAQPTHGLEMLQVAERLTPASPS